MKTWEVEVHLGSGLDTDSIGTYLVYAVDEQDAEDTALGNSRHLISATANLIRNPGAVDEMDYDGVLMSETAKGLPPKEYAVAVREDGSLRMEPDEDAYDPSDPKHPTYHDRMSDAADARES